MVIFNELCILAVSYHLIVFTPFVDNIDIQYNVGWSVIAITVLNILVNMVVMMVFTIKMLQIMIKGTKLRLKQWLQNRKVNKYAVKNETEGTVSQFHLSYNKNVIVNNFMNF